MHSKDSVYLTVGLQSSIKMFVSGILYHYIKYPMSSPVKDSKIQRVRERNPSLCQRGDCLYE